MPGMTEYSIMKEGPGGCYADYKQAVAEMRIINKRFAEHVRTGAKTKGKGLLGNDERINNSMS